MNGLNQYTSAGGLAFSYDANSLPRTRSGGNLTGDSRGSYLYDVENRLVGASGALSATLRYDPLGRLYDVTGGGGTTRFLYDGDALVAEYDGSGVLRRRYVHGSDAQVDDPLFWYEGSGLTDRRGLHTDHQGSVVAVSSAAGTLAAANSYDEWGIPASANVGRFQYTGQAWLAEIGLYHYKARIYSPTLGRFLQTDPVGYDDQINLYAYVANDPVNQTDPTGMCPQCVSGIIGAATGAGLDYGVQVLENLAEGDDLGEALTDVDGGSIVISAVGGAVAGATGVGTGAVIDKVMKAERAAVRAAKAVARTQAKVGTRRAMRMAAQTRRARQAAKSSSSAARRAAAAAAAIKAAQQAAKQAEPKKDDPPKPPEPTQQDDDELK